MTDMRPGPADSCLGEGLTPFQDGDLDREPGAQFDRCLGLPDDYRDLVGVDAQLDTPTCGVRLTSDSLLAVDLWRQRYQEQGRKLHASQSDLGGAMKRIEEVQTLNAVLNKHLKGAIKDLEQAQSEAEELRAENMQLQAALLGARERIRRAERAAEERVHVAEQKLKELESRASTSPPAAPEDWRHSITMGEHLRELAELRRHFEQMLAGAAA